MFPQAHITQAKRALSEKARKRRFSSQQSRGSIPATTKRRNYQILQAKLDHPEGCKDAALFPGAAPIGLIDGDKLLDLLIEHEIGIKKHTISLNEIDESYFSEASESEEVAKTLSEDVTSIV